MARSDYRCFYKLKSIMLSNNLNNGIEKPNSIFIPQSETKKLPKIVGDIRHYPPANKEWKNSIYAYNKNSLRSLPALDKMASKTIKSYFNLTNNKKLARSKRMRNLIRRRTVKRLFASKPEIKQTNQKVNITVYTFNREKQFFLRKMYFYDRNMNINKDVYLYKLWLKKNLLAFKKTFKGRNSLIISKNLLQKRTQTIRKNKNKTYIHNILLKKHLNKNYNKDGTLIKSQFTPKGKPSFLTTSNLSKSIKKRNLIKLLKKREMKKRSSGIALTLKMAPSDASALKRKSHSLEVKAQAFPASGAYLHKTFKNYLINKISRKVIFKVRNMNSIMKIKKKLSKLKRFRFNKIRLPYSNLKFKNEVKFFSFKLVSELKYIRKLFLFYFIKYILSLLKIKVQMSPAAHRIKENVNISNKKSFSNNKFFDRLRYKFMSKNIEDQGSGAEQGLNKPVQLKKSTKQSRSNNKNINKIIYFKNKYSYDKLKNIELLNLELLNFLKLTLNDSKKLVPNGKTTVYKENIDSLYKKFENRYFLIFLAKFFKKEFLYINYYSKFLINQLKFGKFLPGLKLLISKIYSKKVELNIVNLKYSHLNSDIYTDSIATKLKRKISLLRVLKWSLKLARLPYEYISHNNAASLNKLQTLTIHKSLDVNKELRSLSEEKNKFRLNWSEDRLDGVLNKLYPYSLTHNFSRQTVRKELKDQGSGAEQLSKNLKSITLVGKQNQTSLLTETNSEGLALPKNLSVLNIIKYKWVSGVRLEAAGRLTRRYTAARSVFKFRYKGSLKNIDYSQKLDTTKKNMSTVMLRNHIKSNSQYSFTKSKRRIGAFGLKAWISSY